MGEIYIAEKSQVSSALGKRVKTMTVLTLQTNIEIGMSSSIFRSLPREYFKSD